MAATGFLSTRHGQLDFARRTVIMGILNVTPDSFYDGGRRSIPSKAIADGVEMAQAARIFSTSAANRRGRARGRFPKNEELERVLPVIRGLRREVGVPISIDTYKSDGRARGPRRGADIVNDISALRFDPAMVAIVAAEKVPVILMHMQGTPQTMQARSAIYTMSCAK